MKYQITIRDNFFDHELTGEFEANSEYTAKKMAKEYYAYELDTVENAIEIIKVTEILSI